MKSPDSITTIAVVNAIENSELLSEAQSAVFAKSVLDSLPAVKAAAKKE